MACIAIMGLSVVMWTLFGYSLAFGGNHAGIIGDFRWFGLNNVGMSAGPYADSIPVSYTHLSKVIGKFGCKGYDTFGPFKLVGGIAKGHPDEEDIKNAVEFVKGL